MNSLDFAINMELDGEKYYLEQAEKHLNDSLKTVLYHLAKEEKMHAQLLQKFKNNKSFDLNQNDTISNADSIFKNIGTIISEIKEIPNQLDVYRFALENEKASINLYQKYYGEAQDENTKVLFEYLIKQEKNHYTIIDQIVELIMRSEEWVESAEFGIRPVY